MSTPDVTTHNQIVRPERYQPITTDDNVLDRLARLERALYRAGQLIDAQIARGSSEAYLTVPYAGPTTLLSLSYTPAVDCWWDIFGHMAIVGKTDAAYHYAYGYVTLTPADADGKTQCLDLVTQHLQVQQFEDRQMPELFKLVAGTAYTIALQFGGGSGGTWQVYTGVNHLKLIAKAYRR